MIIDCHGHYTTAPDDLKVWRQEQIDVHGERSKMRAPDGPAITDDQIREGLEAHQLRLQRERGTDLTLFSPRAGGLGHHIRNEEMSRQWSRVCNDLIRRICDLYPSNLRPEEHTAALQSLMRIPYAVFCLNKTTDTNTPLH